MALREFTDGAGTRWRVWDVHPGLQRPDLPAVEVPVADRAPAHQARAEALFSERVRRQFAGGWLAFEREGERRRLSPIPAQWEGLSDAELCVLCDRAAPYVVKLPTDGEDVSLGI